jgi:maleylacetoacetate isomerase
MTDIVLYDFWRSSAAYRVRIALNLKGLSFTSVPTSLLDGAHKDPAYVARNPQGLVPMLSIDGQDVTQSLAIIDYLDAIYTEPRLIPSDPVARAKAMSAAYLIASDIHPLNNLRVLKYLKGTLGQEQEAIDAWYRHWVTEGFTALEAMAPDEGVFGGDTANIADICLVPQMYNARRFEVPLEVFPKLVRIDYELRTMEAFAWSEPEAVKPE